jgi:tetratricopeptide (TPR) repeat protein
MPQQQISELLEKGLLDHQSGNLEKARQMYLEILAIDPRHADCLHLLGLVFHQSGQNEIALKMIHRAILRNPVNATFHYSLGVVLLAEGKFSEAEAAFQQALDRNANYYEALVNLGIVQKELGKIQEARQVLERALNFNPDSAEALNNLGNVLLELNQHDEAKACWERALTLKPEFADALNNLGSVHFQLGQMEEAMTCLEHALALVPENVDALLNKGEILRRQGTLNQALACYQQALALKPEYLEAQWHQSLLQLQMGDFTSGWKGYECRHHRKNRPRTFSQPLWRGQPLMGARILLHAEQGLGDSIQFLRYLPMVHAAGGTVLLDIPERLRRLAQELPGIDSLTTAGEPLPAFDWHCPLMSLPLAFGTMVETIPAQVPYLTIPAEATRKAETLPFPSTGLRVGLAWAGRRERVLDQFRSINFAQFEPLFDLKEIYFYSLQMGDGAEQLAHASIEITELAPFTEDMADTAAQMAQLDLIITVDTSVAHLAGSLARPTWLLLEHVPDWRWLHDRDDSPWYPTMRLFRQLEPGNWSAVFQHVRKELEALIRNRSSLHLPTGLGQSK